MGKPREKLQWERDLLREERLAWSKKDKKFKHKGMTKSCHFYILLVTTFKYFFFVFVLVVMWKLFLCSPLWKDTSQSGMRIDCWLTAPHRKDKMTGQDRRDKVFKTYIDRPTYKWIWEVTTQLKDAVSVVSPINTMQHTVDGERTESKTLEATLSAVRISFKESLCYLCLF